MSKLTENNRGKLSQYVQDLAQLKYLTDIIGKKFNKDISRGTRLSLNHIEI